MTVQSRLPGETAKAYRAFCIYRDMGESRSLARVAEELGHKSRQVASRWSTRFNWVERVQAKEALQIEETSNIENQIKRAAATRQMTRAQRLQDMGMGELERSLEFSQQSEVPLIRPPDALKMVEAGFKMERLVMGESTENSDQVVAVRDLSPEEIKRYDQIITDKMLGDQNVSD